MFKKFFRWQGLAALAVFIAVLSLFWLLLVDDIVRRAIEQEGTRALGAKVELAEADFSLFPMGLTLRGLQVTNPDEPMQNAVAISRITGSLDGLNLFFGKAIIEEMTLDGVRLNTPRKTSGAIAERAAVPKAAAPRKRFEIPALKLPDAQEILAKEELESLKRAEAIQSEIKAKKGIWKQRVAQLADKEKIAAYKQRLKELNSLRKNGLRGILEGVKEIAKAREEISRDLKLIKAARNDLKSDFKSLQTQVKGIDKVAYEDVRRLKGKYTLSPQGITNVSKMLLQGKIAAWIEKAIWGYQKITPFLEGDRKRKKAAKAKPLRAKGVNIHFKEEKPLPDFLIRNARISGIETQVGALSGQIRNITPEQDVLGLPLKFVFSGDKIKDVKLLQIDGMFNHIDPTKSKDRVNLLVQEYRARDISLTEAPEWPISLKEGLANMDMQAALRGQALEGKLMAGLRSTKISLEVKDEADAMGKAVASTLENISSFNVTADVTGTLEDYDIRLSSDLEQVLGDTVNKLAAAQAKKLEKGLEAAVFKKISGPLEELNSGLGDLESLDAELTGRLQQVSELP